MGQWSFLSWYFLTALWRAGFSYIMLLPLWTPWCAHVFLFIGLAAFCMSGCKLWCVCVHLNSLPRAVDSWLQSMVCWWLGTPGNDCILWVSHCKLVCAGGIRLYVWLHALDTWLHAITPCIAGRWVMCNQWHWFTAYGNRSLTFLISALLRHELNCIILDIWLKTIACW